MTRVPLLTILILFLLPHRPFLSVLELSLRVHLTGADPPAKLISKRPSGIDALYGDLDQSPFLAPVTTARSEFSSTRRDERGYMVTDATLSLFSTVVYSNQSKVSSSSLIYM